MRQKNIVAIIVAAGRGERVSAGGLDRPKQYRDLLGRPVLDRAITVFLGVEAIVYLGVVINAEHEHHYTALGRNHARLLPPIHGGQTRQQSVLAGLKAIAGLKPDLVLVHDAARPLVSPEIIEGVIAGLATADAALPALQITDTIKRAPDARHVLKTEDRATLFAAQTPQGFRFAQIFSAHMRAARLPSEFTDDAAIAEWAGLSVVLTPGGTRNFKITHPEDFERAERLLLGQTAMETRIGTGFDVHPFEPGDGVWLGGVEIPHDKKLKGHSDADVALHALADALYGALGEGDIGQHFPPSDMQWRGAASKIFLEHAAGLVRACGGRIVNLDVTIVCETPKINPHVAAMRQAIAEACAITSDRVAIKATTSERLGFTGREEGIVAMASASIEVPRQL